MNERAAELLQKKDHYTFADLCTIMEILRGEGGCPWDREHLVEAALAKYPDKKWHYQAARDNAPSIALAKSLGFTLEGAGLFIV